VEVVADQRVAAEEAVEILAGVPRDPSPLVRAGEVATAQIDQLATVVAAIHHLLPVGAAPSVRA
jgi:hypothetical protein